MRILHLGAGKLFGGLESFLLTLAEFREFGRPAEPHFSLCFPGRFRDGLIAVGAPVHDLGPVRFSRPWTLWRARRKLRQLLSRERIDLAVSHACWPHAAFAPVVRAARVPLVSWVHDILGGTHILERWAKRTPPDLVIANSRFTAASVPKVFHDVPCEVIYIPVASRASSTHYGDRTQIRQELSTAPDAVIGIITCRFERWKGHRLLIDALSRLRSLPGWVWWVVGGAQRPAEKAYLDELRTAIEQAGLTDRVRFLGMRSDVPRLLSAADIHCQPNTGPEPFGIAFIEALAAGLPVVTTRMGAACEIVDDSCAILVEPDRPEQLAEALGRLMADPLERHKLGSAGPAVAKRLCDPAQQMGRMTEAFEDVIQRRPKGN